MISSLQNERVKYWNSLKNTKERNYEKLFIVEGEHLVEEALKNNIVKTIIYCNELPKLNYKDVEIVEVSEKVIEKLASTKSPQKIMAICHFMEDKKEYGNKIVFLDGVQDPGNGGTIIRSALAFNFDNCLISNESFDIYNDKFIRSTQGAFFALPINKVNNVEEIKRLKEMGYTIIVTNLRKDSIELRSLPKLEKIVLVLGNEGNGVSKEVIELADYNVIIKISNKVESLNVASAASICMYKFMD